MVSEASSELLATYILRAEGTCQARAKARQKLHRSAYAAGRTYYVERVDVEICGGNQFRVRVFGIAEPTG